MTKIATKKAVKTKTTTYDLSEHLHMPEERAAYLDAWLEEAPEGAAGMACALGDIARASLEPNRRADEDLGGVTFRLAGPAVRGTSGL